MKMKKKYMTIADIIKNEVNVDHNGMSEISEANREGDCFAKHYYAPTSSYNKEGAPITYPLMGVKGIKVISYGKDNHIIGRNYFKDNIWDSGISTLSDYVVTEDTTVNYVDGTASCTRTSISLKKGDRFILQYGLRHVGGYRAYFKSFYRPKKS